MSIIKDGILNPLHGMGALLHRELAQWYRDFVVLFISLIQPVIWLGLFGKAFDISKLFTVNTPPIYQQLADQAMLNTFGTTSYYAFFAAGMLSFIAITTAVFGSMSIVWDRRLGFLERILSTPVSRGAIVMTKVLAATIRTLVQVAVILAFAVALGFPVTYLTPLRILGAFAAVALLSMSLSSLLILLGIRTTNYQRPMVVANLITLPLMFTSNAIYPIKLMPSWLQIVAKLNPVTYTTDIVRILLLNVTTETGNLLFNFIILLGFALIASVIGITVSWRYLTM